MFVLLLLACREPTSTAALTLDCAPTTNVLRWSCQVTADPPSAITVAAVPDDGLGLAPTFERASADEHAVIVGFLAPESTYTVTASTPDGRAAHASIETPSLPEEIRTWMKVVGTATVPLIGSDNPCALDSRAVIYDTGTGRVVWYHELDPKGTLSLENMVRFTPERTVIGATGQSLVEVDLDGNELHAFAQGVDIDGYLHHDLFTTATEVWALAKHADSSTADELQLDYVLVLDRFSGAERGRWQTWDHLPVPKEATGNYFHLNSIWLDGTGTAYLSSWQQAAVLAVDANLGTPSFGEVRWTMVGDVDASVFDPVLTIDWNEVGEPHRFARQHAASIRADGRLMLFDNPNERAIVMTLDVSGAGATVDDTYRAEETICGGQGTAAETPTGNVLVACTTDSVREFDLATHEIVWSGEARCVNGQTPVAARWYPLPWM